MAEPSATEIENADAKKVDEAIQKLFNGEVKSALSLLFDIISGAPDQYTRAYKTADGQSINFWDVHEFTHYCTDPANQIQEDINRIPSAYPRAFYYLGFAHVKLKDHARAIQFLDQGLKLEEHPILLMERGNALSGLKRHEEALASYQQAFELPGSIAAQIRAIALRGRGFQLIELQQVDLAEEAFIQSLQLDPNNAIALSELQYIAHLRKGGAVGPKQMVERKSALECGVCGARLGEGSIVTNVDGRSVWRCRECAVKLPAGPGSPGLPSSRDAMTVNFVASKKTRRWWQFWK